LSGHCQANGRPAERLPVTFQVADAEALPFVNGSFDVALSTFGVMFTPNQEQAASELRRVVRKGGRIGLANWTPDGFIGQLFKVMGRHVPPPAGVSPPAVWGSEDRLRELFPGCKVQATRQHFKWRYKSASHWLDVFKTYYGPTNRAFAALDASKQVALQSDIVQLLESLNVGGKDSLIVPSAYLETVINV
jgi:ubiquinone/menaquinone biosynthesis C-methylase UbiE